MREIKKFRIYYSKREKDWVVAYPDRGGKICGSLFFDMFKIEENINWNKTELDENCKLVNKRNPDTLKKFLTDKGYDYTTLKISCEKLSLTK